MVGVREFLDTAAVKQIRSDGEIAMAGEPAGDVLDVCIDPEGFLQNDDCPLCRGGRLRDEGAHRTAMCGNRNPLFFAHRFLLSDGRVVTLRLLADALRTSRSARCVSWLPPAPG